MAKTQFTRKEILARQSKQAGKRPNVRFSSKPNLPDTSGLPTMKSAMEAAKKRSPGFKTTK